MKTGGDQADGLRMLHGLGVAPAAAPRSTPGWRRWLAAAALLALGLGVFAWRQPLLQSIPKPASLASKVDVAAATPIPPIAAVEPAPEASAAPSAMIEPGVAASAAADAAATTTAVPAPAPVLPPPGAAPRPELQSKPRGAQRSPAHAARPAHEAGPAHAARQSHAARQAAAAAPAAGSRKPAAPVPSVPEPGRDPDVDLVAALMAHVGGGPAQAPAHPGGTASGAPQPAVGARAVTRAAVDQRVQRCKASHPDDREASRACRRRVCEGLWGRFPACPVRLMPRAATTA